MWIFLWVADVIAIFLSVADGKPLKCISVLWLVLLPWWLMLLPLSCRLCWLMVLPYVCEMVIPHLLLFVICGYFCKWQMLLTYFYQWQMVNHWIVFQYYGWCYCHGGWCCCHLVADYVGWCYCHSSWCYCYIFCKFGWCYCHSGWCHYHFGTFVLADVIAMVADVKATQGVYRLFGRC